MSSQLVVVYFVYLNLFNFNKTAFSRVLHSYKALSPFLKYRFVKVKTKLIVDINKLRVSVPVLDVTMSQVSVYVAPAWHITHIETAR